MAQGLNPSRLVRVPVNMSPLAAARKGFGTLLVVTDSDALDPIERIRAYDDASTVAADFGADSEVMKAAVAYFAQKPKPRALMVGRWVKTDSPAELLGGILGTAEQDIAAFQAITAGGMTLSIDGAAVTVTALDLSSVQTLSEVASELNSNTAFTAVASASWNGQRFTISSKTAVSTSAVDFPASTPLSNILKLTQALGARKAGVQKAETLTECIETMLDRDGQWYGLAFATDAALTDDECMAVARRIEATESETKRIVGFTVTDTKALDPTITDDLGSKLKAAGLQRAMWQYSSSSKYAVCSLFGRMFSVNFAANKSTITLMFKKEPTISPEILSATQANTLKAKRGNVFVAYSNDTAIVQNGVMAAEAYIDERHGLDWFADAVQIAQWNALYQSTTKIPQTDAGQTVLVNAVVAVCGEAINNGLAAPGQWNSDGFGQLKEGDFLKAGFYVYAPPMAAQDQSIREQRIAQPIQVALKLAGAIHEVDVIVNVNR